MCTHFLGGLDVREACLYDSANVCCMTLSMSVGFTNAFSHEVHAGSLGSLSLCFPTSCDTRHTQTQTNTHARTRNLLKSSVPRRFASLLTSGAETMFLREAGAPDDLILSATLMQEERDRSAAQAAF